MAWRTFTSFSGAAPICIQIDLERPGVSRVVGVGSGDAGTDLVDHVDLGLRVDHLDLARLERLELGGGVAATSWKTTLSRWDLSEPYHFGFGTSVIDVPLAHEVIM